MLGYTDFIVGLNIGVLLVMLLFGLRMLLSFKKINIDVLKARMFLTRGLIDRMWMYSSLSGGLLVLYVLTTFSKHYGYIKIQAADSLALLAFLIPFTVLTKTWYNLIISSVEKEPEDKATDHPQLKVHPSTHHRT